MKSPDPSARERLPLIQSNLAAEPGPVRSDERDTSDYSTGRESWERRGSPGTRNLVLGVLILLGTVAIVGQVILEVGPRALLPIAAALAAILTLFVLARARVLRQRNGGFLSLAIACLVAALIPLAEYAWSRPLAAKTEATAGPAPERSTPAPSAASAADSLPLLTQSFNVPPVTGDSPRFKVLRDFHVEMSDNKVYLIKAGEILPIAETAEGEVRFIADNQKIGLPDDMVERMGPAAQASPTSSGNPAPADTAGTPALVSGPPAAAGLPAGAEMKNETPAQITARSQQEAIRRYPALGQKDSPENQLFVATFQELKHSGADDFFADPEWPIQLAELLAKRENWQRQP